MEQVPAASFEIKIRFKDILEKHDQVDEETTLRALYDKLRRAAFGYYEKLGSNYHVELSQWAEDFRAAIEACVDYLIAFYYQEREDTFHDLVPRFRTLINQYVARTRRRKLELLRA